MVENQAKPAWKDKDCPSSQKDIVNWWLGKEWNKSNDNFTNP